MTRKGRILAMGLLALLLLPGLTAVAQANAAEPPGLTVLVSNPPAALSVSLRLAGSPAGASVTLREERVAWEAYYRFYYHASPRDADSLEGAVLQVQSSEGDFSCPLPGTAFATYNNLVTLDLRTRTLSTGQPAWRTPLLVALRVTLTLLLEGLVFLLFGYRTRRSWLAFAAVNLLTQGGLNALITGPGSSAYFVFGYGFGELVVMAVETAAFACLLREHGRGRAALCAVAANAVSLLAGGLLLHFLPI